MTRIAPLWLAAVETQVVFAALHAAGGEARAVGGAVRDALLGTDAADVDIATTLRPPEVKVACAVAGLRTIDTGIGHGTVTVVSGARSFEVTTLRRDVATDGRHAEVAFTDDWAADAARRDFTINALYCDADGTVSDPLGGVADLEAGRVRFIGDATARIREDYLRILRFFRFSARFARGDLDADGLAACSRERAGLRRLSAERVRGELPKLLVAPRAGEIVDIMQAHGYWPALLGCVVAPVHLARSVALTRDAIDRLAALAVSTAEHAELVSQRLKLSGAERDRLVMIAAGVRQPWMTMSARDVRRAVYAMGRAEARAAAAVALARVGHDGAAQRVLERIDATVVPEFPIAGRDLLAAAWAPGPDIGRRLARAEAAWIASDFTLDREALLSIATAPDG